jgi:outer membrane protein assembly factor BamB
MLSFLSELNSDGLLLVRLAGILIRVTVMLTVGCCVGICLHRQSAAIRHGWWLTTLLAVLLSIGIATTVATAGRVIVRNAAGKTVATLVIPDVGSATIELDGNSASRRESKARAKRPMASGGEWLQLGGDSHRNKVNLASRLPYTWNVKTGKNILWSADLGSQTYGTPLIADGKIFVGTNNGRGYIKRFPKETNLGCLVCFDVATGKFLWQHSNKKLATGRVHDWPLQGIVSTPVVKANRLYYLTNRAVVTCLDTNGMRDGDAGPFRDERVADDEADVVWQYDLMAELGVSPKSISGCSPMTDGERLFILTSNGTDASNVKTPNPNAPSFVCLDLKTGKLLWSAKAAFAARNCQWSGPSIGTFTDRGGKPQTHVMFPGSDGWLYSFDPKGDGHGNARLLWKFDCNPKDAKFLFGGRGRKNLHVSMPVIHNGLVYVATGRNPEAGEGDGDLWWIDPKRRTHGPDISEFIVNDKGGKILPVTVTSHFDRSRGHTKRSNPESGVVWHYTGMDLDRDGRIEFEETFHRTWGSPVIQNGLLVIADFSGLVHCLRADTGKLHWTYDMYAACWGLPLIADGRIFVGDEDGELAILKLDKTPKLIGVLNCESPIYSTPVAVGNTLFLATNTRLLAIGQTQVAVNTV